MKLTLKRIAKKLDYTIGRLYVDGVYVCDTLEDRDRGLKDSMAEAFIIRKKIYGQTAIPTGTYHIDMDTYSPKFGNRVWARNYRGRIPRLLSVKGYSGVLIHVGNTAKDTEGCILVGKNKVVGKVLESTAAFRDLMDKYLVPAHIREEEITITIE